jgi:hypothetical protein
MCAVLVVVELTFTTWCQMSDENAKWSDSHIARIARTAGTARKLESHRELAARQPDSQMAR